MFKSSFIAALVILLAACSTTPVTKATATRVPPSRIYAPQFVTQQAGATARVSFFRDSGFVGGGCTHTIFVNGVRAFAIEPAEYIVLYLQPGRYLFQLKTGAGICPDIDISQATTLEPGSNEAYRILLPSDGGLRLTRIK